MAPHSNVEGNHLEYVLTGEDYVAFQMHAATTLAETRRQLFQYRIGGALGLALLVVILDVTTRDDGLAWTLVFAAIPAALWWGLSPQLMQRSMRRTLTRIADTSGLGHVGPTSLRLDAHGVHEECGGVATSAEWPEILRVDETRGARPHLHRTHGGLHRAQDNRDAGRRLLVDRPRSPVIAAGAPRMMTRIRRRPTAGDALARLDVGMETALPRCERRSDARCRRRLKHA
jgi:hypothetical protein